jgi:hypothetical protein
MNKVIREGQVAILMTMGPSTTGWYSSHKNRDILFDPELVNMVESGAKEEDLRAYCQTKYPNVDLSSIGNLVVEWVPEGSFFKIDFDEGVEGIHVQEPGDWIRA